MDKSQETTLQKEPQKDHAEDKYRLYASMAFIIVVIVIGVPMWWKTTEVYRVSLPSSDIMSLSEEPIKTAVNIGLFSMREERAKLLIEELKAEFENNDMWCIQFEPIPYFEKAESARTPAALETLILQQYEMGPGDFIFIEWSRLQEEVLITNERSALIRNDTTSSKIKQVLNLYILQTHRVQQVLTKDRRYASKNDAPPIEYDVIVSVLNPRPDIMDAKWNVQMAVETYLMPYLQQVSHVSNYTLKTQWKYQLAFETDLKQVRDDTPLGRHYAIAETSLPHIITAIEKNLGVGITDKTPINLVVYIPPCDIAPIYIYNRQNKRVTKENVNSFISPKWGGIIIANPPQDTCVSYNESPKRFSFYVNTNDVMQIMLYQLQKLLDISVEVNIDGVESVALEELAPRRWEYESYLRRSTITHIATATNTLQSLIKLLDNINYIVITDDVGAAINAAYEHIQLAKAALADHQLLRASEMAKSAFAASEQAFFDASLLAQLYFPDEQKYAIYIPLFLPIMVPVISSLLMKKRGKASKNKAN